MTLQAGCPCRGEMMSDGVGARTSSASGHWRAGLGEMWNDVESLHTLLHSCILTLQAWLFAVAASLKSKYFFARHCLHVDSKV